MAGIEMAQCAVGSRDVVVGVSPFERPDAALVLAVVRAGALGVLDLGRDRAAAHVALAALCERAPDSFGVRIPFGCPLGPDDLPEAVDTVMLHEPRGGVSHWRRPGRRVLVEVRSLDEAREALAVGADGLVGRGSEGGGRVGEGTAFVLLQQLLRTFASPVWVAGGIGVHSAAAAIAGGASGVILDAQLALTRESTIRRDVAAAIAAMDGSETRMVGSHRVYVRPDLPVGSLASDIALETVAGMLGADDLQQQLLPAGQDAAFAAPLAARWPAAGALVSGVRREIARHLAAARRARPLAPGSPFAASHGLRFPIVQGPMTRVSDRAAFATAVADGGGLPLLALALMTGPECRALLEETRSSLRTRPWGVGILGFVPRDVREAQLREIIEVRPPVALIAGGRPSQARSLEEAGIATYLHVPSPGLLERFVHDGARRFVFEGLECGGHVGPRSSFALWEAQIETLLTLSVAGEVSVLFAGGIHDARSAAMVAALAGTLAGQGARVGMLMGTAYLFTEEAVLSGAILPGFQRVALACESTVLLETAPGHSTRCAPTPYVSAYETERERLRNTGTDPKEAWAALEALNLGRLRIASKGISRHGNDLVAVEPADQQQEGMFMLGQVAAMRSTTSTIEELHADVSIASCRLLDASDQLEKDLLDGDVPAVPPPAKVAIVGMACVFPGAPDSESYWANIVQGKDAVSEVPTERWDPGLYYDPDAVSTHAGEKTPSKWGGFLPEVAFDALAYGIPPRSLAAIEPVQLLALEVAARALADAGYGMASGVEFDRSRASVVFGAEAGTDLSSAYGFRALARQYLGSLPDQLDELLPELTEDSFPGLLSNVIAGRIANRLDLGGINYTVDAACASSLAAVDVAVKELRSGTSDMVLCGGADLHNSINDYLLFAAVHALSPTGRCASFDASADGIVLGEGVACVVLKRLDDARRDGDRIYAVLESVAGSSDGRSLGLTAPRPEGQRLALERAYEQARVSPSDVGLVEAHGTGTAVGDRTELSVLTDLFDHARVAPASCALGSVKSQIGHTKCAAGLAGLIKVARALYHGVLPPTIHLEHPNPAFDPARSPFAFYTAARPWPAERRVAGVSAFGFGGTNFHAVLSAPDPVDQDPLPSGLQQWPAELFLFRGDRESMLATIGAVERHAAGSAAPPLRDLAAAAARAGSGAVLIAIVARNHADLLTKLSTARSTLEGDNGSGVDEPGVFVSRRPDGEKGQPARLAFLFPGQGSQSPGMLADLFIAFPWLQHHLRRGARWSGTIFPPAAFGAEERRAQVAALTDTRVAQPALGMVELAVTELLNAMGVAADVVAGHSYGELGALTTAGALGEEDLLALSEARAEAILEAAGDDPGAMAAVAASADEVLEVLGEHSGIVPANDNAPRQIVISGPTPAIDGALARLDQAGISARRIPVACAFHSPVVAGAAITFADHLARSPISTPRIPVWSNTTASPYPSDPHSIATVLANQLAEPVRFRRQIESMYDAGTRIFLEVGPGSVLTGLVGRILKDKEHTALAIDAGASSLESLLTALGELAVQGVDLDPAVLFEGRVSQLDINATPAAPRGWRVNGHLLRSADGEIVPGGLRPANEHAARVDNLVHELDASLSVHGAMTVQASTLGSNGHRSTSATNGSVSAGQAALDSREEPVIEYLRTLREAVAAGRDVMLSYLGGPVPDRAPAHQSRDDTIPDPLEAALVAPPPPPDQPGDVADFSRDAIQGLVLDIVSGRTGYPIDMLDVTLDLEADLSIDSVKRLEIMSTITDRIGIRGGSGDDDDSVMEELVRLKTLDGIVTWLVAARSAHMVPDTERPVADTLEDVPDVALRMVPRLVQSDPPATSLAPATGRTIAVTDDGKGIAAALAARLEREGAKVHVVPPGAPLDNVDTLVHLEALEPRAIDCALGLFERAKEAIVGGATTILGVSAMGGAFGMGEATGPQHEETLRFAGMRGVVKAIRRELPEIDARLVDLDPALSPDACATALAEELLSKDPGIEVGRTASARFTVIVAEENEPAALDGATLQLDAGSVVLVTGGARGITAGVVIGLARRWRCRFVLVGRSEEPAPEENPELAEAADAFELRRYLARSGWDSPAAIEREVRRISAGREIRATLHTLDELGVEAEYRRVDVRDPVAARRLVADVYQKYGRIDGVIHGAGVIEDCRVVDKTSGSFSRVYETKVTGASALLESIGPDVRFVVLFSSIAGIFGNRGQVDYAAANDALATMARWYNRRIPAHVLAVDWGPWHGGVVTPELEREFARRGIGLLDTEDAIERLIHEIGLPSPEAEIVLVRARPHRFAWHADAPHVTGETALPPRAEFADTIPLQRDLASING